MLFTERIGISQPETVNAKALGLQVGRNALSMEPNAITVCLTQYDGGW